MQTLDGRAITVREDREDWSLKGSGGQERTGPGRGGGRGAPRQQQAEGGGDKTGRQVQPTKLWTCSWPCSHAQTMRDSLDSQSAGGCPFLNPSRAACPGHAVVSFMLSEVQLAWGRVMCCSLGSQDLDSLHAAQVVVHGLPYSMEWQDLKDLVKPYSNGTVRVDIAKGYDGRSRGYGTVLFDGADDARSCIQVCRLTSCQLNCFAIFSSLTCWQSVGDVPAYSIFQLSSLGIQGCHYSPVTGSQSS